MKKLLIFDSHSILYKSYFAFIRAPLRNSKGMNTSAVFGFLRYYFSILRQFEPDYICFAFDKSRKTFRSEIYPEYKAHRDETPEDLRAQFPYARAVAEAMEIKTLMLDGFEADDILGSLSHQLCEAHSDLRAYLITGDRDSFQLVNDSVFVGYTSSKAREGVELYDLAAIRDKYGVEPESLIEVKALQGDPSDNIPGVKGVGEKTALKLIREWGTLNNLYENLDSIKGKLRERLESDRDSAFLSHKLARINLGINLEVDLSDLEFPREYGPKLLEILKELEFQSLIETLYPELPEPISQPVERPPTEYALVLEESELSSLCSTLQSAQTIAFDTETDSLNPYRANLVGLALSWSQGKSVYIPFLHSETNGRTQLSHERVLDKIRPLFEDPSKTWIAHNLKYDMAVLKKYDFQYPPCFRDTLILAHLLYPGTQLGLKALANRLLGEDRIKFKELMGDQDSFSQADLETACEYACADADNTLALYELFGKELEQKPGLRTLANNIEFPLIEVLEKMEETGIKIDREHFRTLSEELERESKRVRIKVFQIAGEEFNLNSTKQLQKILMERLEIPLTRKTKTGFSTATDVLEELAPKYPICALITEYRHLVKLLNTYTLPLPEQADEKGILRTSFQQTIAATGRLSSTAPNLQNIPVKTEWGQKIRKGFRSGEPFWKLVSIDYSQIELRVLAHMCSDQALIEAFRHDRDIHRETAAKVFGKPLGEVTKEERESSKAINFGIIYGISAFGLSRQLQIPMVESRKFIDTYFEAFPKIREFMD
ncbi:DNA polymerase I, partial [bacterium]|nr:DNA polymerase I [bacterium]